MLHAGALLQTLLTPDGPPLFVFLSWACISQTEDVQSSEEHQESKAVQQTYVCSFLLSSIRLELVTLAVHGCAPATTHSRNQTVVDVFVLFVALGQVRERVCRNV